MPTAPEQHPVVQLLRHRQAEGTCGRCRNFVLKDGYLGEAGVGRCEFRSTKTGECTVQDADPQNDAPDTTRAPPVRRDI